MSAPAHAIRENPQLDLTALRRLKYDELERPLPVPPSGRVQFRILKPTPWRDAKGLPTEFAD